MPASCSVAFIRPISAVSAEPARPANSSAETTGPSSRTSDSATTTPSRVVALQAEHHADEQPGDDDDHQRQHADRVQLGDHQAGARQQGRQAGQHVGQEQVAAAEALEHPESPTTERREPVVHAPSPPSRSSARSGAG
jgi:hypothetical protein